jgi:subtilisin family serine protease
MKAKYFIIFLLFTCQGILQGQDFVVEIKLKQDVKDFSLTNDKQIKSLSQTYKNSELKQSYPGAKTPELLLYYTLRGNGAKNEIVSNYLKTGLFEGSVREFEMEYVLSCNTPISVNDPLYNDNNYDNFRPLNLIQAPCAWTITKSNPNVHIGIADTDFELTHEDLKNKIVRIMGPVSAENTHGIGTAGIAGAETNNSKGIASVMSIAKYRIKFFLILPLHLLW